jgi:hypothetical protein
MLRNFLAYRGIFFANLNATLNCEEAKLPFGEKEN